MFSYSHKLISLMVRCILFSLTGGCLFTAVSGSDLGLIPYIIAFGADAGWQLTRPMGMIAVGSNGIIFTAFFFAVRLALALIIGWIILIPYSIYLVIQTIRGCLSIRCSILRNGAVFLFLLMIALMLLILFFYIGFNGSGSVVQCRQ